MQRYRSGMEHNRGEEFDAAFARIDRVGQDRFDVYWMRHTGKWWRLHAGVTLAEALQSSKPRGPLSGLTNQPPGPKAGCLFPLNRARPQP